MPAVDTDELMGAVEAAAYLGITPARVYLLSKQGRLGRRIGGYWLYTRAELDAWKAVPKSKGGRPKSEAPAPSRSAGATGN